LRRGAEYVRDNGSPWPWPLYPWSLFAFLALAVVGRAFLLCMSMHPILGANVIFGPYFLIPFGFALTVLLLEAGLVSRRPRIIAAALSAPIALVGLALVGHRSDPVYQEFLNLFTARTGGEPVWCTVVLAACFYAYAAVRRAAWALESLTGAL